jgi:hypothetical protein
VISLKNKLKDGCDMSDRKNKITKILLGAMYPTENEFLGAVDAFSKSKLSLTEIESLAKTMTPEYQAGKQELNDTQARRAGVF